MKSLYYNQEQAVEAITMDPNQTKDNNSFMASPDLSSDSGFR